MSEVVVKGGVSQVQAIANGVIEWSRENRVQLNADKCKELRISFAKEQRSQGGLVVINRASHLCDPGSTLASGRMWAEFQSISI